MESITFTCKIKGTASIKKIIMQIKIIGINNIFANNFCSRLDLKGKNSAMKIFDMTKSGIATNKEAKPLKFDA